MTRRLRHLLRLLKATFWLSFQRDVTYRADVVANGLFTLLGTAGTLITIAAVFQYVDQLAGNSSGEAVAILGTFLVINGFLLTFVEPNVELFASIQIVRGGLDELLLRPASSLFLATLGRSRPRALVDVVVGAGVLAGAVLIGGVEVTAASVAWWLVLVAVAVTVAWSIRVLLAIGAFWAPGLEISALFQSLWQLGRFPVDVYAPFIRALLTYVIPLVLVATVPADALTGDAPWWVLPGALGLGAVSVAVTCTAWAAGLRRYTSATS